MIPYSSYLFDRALLNPSGGPVYSGKGSPVVAILDNDCATPEEFRRHPEGLHLLDVRDLRQGPCRSLLSGSHALGCACIIGGRSGIAPGVPVLVVGAHAASVLQAQVVEWAAGLPGSPDFPPQLEMPPPIPADIISISLLLADEPPLVEALKRVSSEGRSDKGTVVVLAAGNLGQRSAQAIARHGFCLTVGASSLNENDVEGVAAYSNYGIHVDIYAPSGARLGRHCTSVRDKVVAAALPFVDQEDWVEDDLLRLPPGSIAEDLRGYYSLEAGTSTSTALVAGTVALMLRVNPELTAKEVKQMLRETAVRLPDSGHGEILRVDAAAAVATAKHKYELDHRAQRAESP